ncbi:MAG: hypothetical protein HUJ53_00540 [Holdemanella sp.]|nr:hypothetical protein [Holdemanella sp.]
MREVRISDVTMKQSTNSKSMSLTFKEKIELTKLLDRLGVNIIEVEAIENPKIGSLRVKSIASSIKDSICAVAVKLDEESVKLTWEALKEAKHPRLQVVAAISTAQMEYIYRKKAPAMLEAIKSTIKACKGLCSDVEFIADDATRSDKAFMYTVIKEAILAGATTITVYDTAGAMLPDEFTRFIDDLYENVPELKDVTLGVGCSDDLSMADACAIAAVIKGAGEVKAAAYPENNVSLEKIAKILASKESECKAHCTVKTTQIKRITSQIRWMCTTSRNDNSPFDNGVRDNEGSDIILNDHDDMQAVSKVVSKLGYDLSDDDIVSVYNAFKNMSKKKEFITGKELDAIVATVALQVPPTYVLESYVINSGNTINATGFMRLRKGDEVLEGVCIGNGPVDAAFLAIEKIVGRHYEMDDFQIQAVTEGHEAMGETVVKLRSEGKLYSGRGISIDVVGSSIMAYINALNKIVYEEEE